EIESSCPPALRGLLKQVIAIRASKTACVLGYWGHWREAGALMHQFTSARNWRLPYHVPAAVCSTPIGSILGASWRAIHRTARSRARLGFNHNGHAAATRDSRFKLQNSKLSIVAVVEATNVNAVAKNVFEFYRAAKEARDRAGNFPTIELSLVTFDRTSSG